MPDEWLSVGVVVVKRASSGPFATHEWLPGTILPAAPPVAPWTSLGGGAGSESFYAGPATLQLHPAETAHYRDNLESPEPRIWVQLRPGPGPEGEERLELIAATVDPYEGEALADSMGDVLVAVAMPQDLEARLAAFFATHHVEREFYKRQRKRADPDALGRRGRVDRPFLGVHDARARRHHLHVTGDRAALVAETVAMGDRAVAHIGDDLHVAMRMRVEAGARRNLVVVPHAQPAPAHARGVAIAGEGEMMARAQPAMVGTAQPGEGTRIDHRDWLLRMRAMARDTADLARRAPTDKRRARWPGWRAAPILSAWLRTLAGRHGAA